MADNFGTTAANLAGTALTLNPAGQIASGIGNVVLSAYELWQGHKQRKTAEELAKKLVDPIYHISEQSTKSLRQAETLASPRTFSGQTQAEQGINQTTAKTSADVIKSATSGPEALAALTGINANELATKNNLTELALRDYNERQRMLMAERKSYAQEEKEKQMRDVYDKFYRQSAAVSALRFGNVQNTAAGIYQAGQGGSQLASGLMPVGGNA